MQFLNESACMTLSTNTDAVWSGRPRRPRRRIVLLTVSLLAVLGVSAGGLAIASTRHEQAQPPTLPRELGLSFSSTEACSGPSTSLAGAAPLKAPSADDEFDSWVVRYTDSVAFTRFAASSDAVSGSLSLSLTNPTGVAQAAPDRLEQAIPVSPGESLTLSFWSKGIASSGSEVGVILGPNKVAERLEVNTTIGDWVESTVQYRVPSGLTSLNVAVIIDNLVGEVLVDELRILRGGEVITANAGFEESSAILSVSNGTMLFNAADRSDSITLVGRVGESMPVTWCVSNGEREYGGTTDVADGPVEIPVRYSTPGLYDLRVAYMYDGQPVEKVVKFGVVPEPNGVASGTGLAGHFRGGLARMTNAPETMALLGADSVRLEIPWQRVEATPGQYAFPEYIDRVIDSYASAGVEVLAVPAYYNPNYDAGLTPSTPAGTRAYAEYAAAILARYPQAGSKIEVYNEFDHTFNTGKCGHTPSCYDDLLVPTTERVKQHNPATVVYGPSTAGMQVRFDWLEPFIAGGGLDHVDVLSFHPYTQPEGPLGLDEQLARLNEIVAAAKPGVDVPISLTEMGWATVEGWVSPEEQAAYTVQMQAIAVKAGIDSIYWFTLADEGSDRTNHEASFGFFETPNSFIPNAYQPKASAVALAVSQRMLGGAQFRGMEAWGEDVVAMTFTDSDGGTVSVLWAEQPVAAFDLAGLPEGALFDMNGVAIDRANSIAMDIDPIYLVQTRDVTD